MAHFNSTNTSLEFRLLQAKQTQLQVAEKEVSNTDWCKVAIAIVAVVAGVFGIIAAAFLLPVVPAFFVGGVATCVVVGPPILFFSDGNFFTAHSYTVTRNLPLVDTWRPHHHWWRSTTWFTPRHPVITPSCHFVSPIVHRPMFHAPRAAFVPNSHRGHLVPGWR